MTRFVAAATDCLKKYTDVSGRTSKNEFWYFVSTGFCTCILAYILGDFISLDVGPVLSIFILLALVVPIATATVRRFHDIDKSGWLALILAITGIGIIAIIWFAMQHGDTVTNRFGDPATGD